MRLDAAALAPVVEGEQPLFVRVERAADILQALSLKREFTKLKLVLVGVSEGWMVAERIAAARVPVIARSEEHTSELQSLMRISYAVFCLKKKIQRDQNSDY